jgi:hypothetical protein
MLQRAAITLSKEVAKYSDAPYFDRPHFLVNAFFVTSARVIGIVPYDVLVTS